VSNSLQRVFELPRRFLRLQSSIGLLQCQYSACICRLTSSSYVPIACAKKNRQDNQRESLILKTIQSSLVCKFSQNIRFLNQLKRQNLVVPFCYGVGFNNFSRISLGVYPNQAPSNCKQEHCSRQNQERSKLSKQSSHHPNTCPRISRLLCTHADFVYIHVQTKYTKTERALGAFAARRVRVSSFRFLDASLHPRFPMAYWNSRRSSLLKPLPPLVLRV